MKYTKVDYLAVYQLYPPVTRGTDNNIVQRKLQNDFLPFYCNFKED